MSNNVTNSKYRPFEPINNKQRLWPSKVIVEAPIWCSVDLRDGNQALSNPMTTEKKLELYNCLLELGFKEIEVGFPSASKTDYDFIRYLIDNNLIPSDVQIQVLTQARSDLIKKTFEAIEGAKQVILHLYNSTSEQQRRQVFKLDKDGITAIAVEGTNLIREYSNKTTSKIQLQYSPESFTQTELDYSLEICTRVMDSWFTKDNKQNDSKIILNLPATVEVCTPNIYADMIEIFSNSIPDRDKIILSLHPHNDRGCAVAASELGLLAGADRIEGTLFGNGERTGNVDLITLALNLFSQGVGSNLKLTDINKIRKTVEYCNEIPVHPRHPYAGDYVFTAFSGSHQDAINKGFLAMKTSNSKLWDVPYLPIDPSDIGRNYEPIIRINSQSGKGGIAYIMKTEFNLDMPRALQIEFAKIVQKASEKKSKELTSFEIWQNFEKEYLKVDGNIEYLDHIITSKIDHPNITEIQVNLIINNQTQTINGEGNGPLDALISAIERQLKYKMTIEDYHQDAIGAGSDAKSVTYLELRGRTNTNPKTIIGNNDIMSYNTFFGIGIHPNILTSSIIACLNGLSRLIIYKQV